MDARRTQFRLRPDRRKQKPQLYRYTLATVTIVQLTHIKDGVSSPVPSHAGDRIALTRNTDRSGRERRSRFCEGRLHAERLRRRRATSTSSTSSSSQRTVKGTPIKITSIFGRSKADGRDPKQLTSGQYSEGFDAWSTDDRTILFDSLRYESVDSGPSDVYTIPSSALRLRQAVRCKK